MDKFEVEKLSMKMETLDNLLLAMETAIFSGNYDVSNFRRGFAYLTDMAMEVSSELNKMTEGAFANGRAKN